MKTPILRGFFFCIFAKNNSMKYENRIALRLKEYNDVRKRAGRKRLTKSDLALIIFKDKDISDLSKGQLLSKYIRGTVDVPLRYAKAIAIELKCSVDHLCYNSVKDKTNKRLLKKISSNMN